MIIVVFKSFLLLLDLLMVWSTQLYIIVNLIKIILTLRYLHMDLNSKFYNFVREFQVILNTLSMNNKKYRILTKEENLASNNS
jgi:hypothetical protein